MDDTDRAAPAEVIRAAKSRFMAEGGADRLADALETIRKRLCAYGPDAQTCDCKYGASFTGEQTGCPELRQAVEYVRDTQRSVVAANQDGDTEEQNLSRAIGLVTRELNRRRSGY